MIEMIAWGIFCFLLTIIIRYILDKIMVKKAKYFDFTKTRVSSVVDDPIPNIYDKAGINAIQTPPRAMEIKLTGRYNWFGYGEEKKDEK
jgi:hypothetical protein